MGEVVREFWSKQSQEWSCFCYNLNMNNFERKENDPNSITEIYGGYADELEHNPNYERLKKVAVPGEMTIEQYVGYLRERAADNYTNQTAREEEERFRKFVTVLG